MKRSILSALWSLLSLAAVVFVTSTPLIAHACPMCFAGGDDNKDAFLYGSIFLMIVPVTSLGGLAYWAYRRLKASDDGTLPPDTEPAEAPRKDGANGVVLRMSTRR